MSHVVTIKTQIKDFSALKMAIKRLGGEVVENVDKYTWWGHHVGDYPLPAGFTKEEMGTCHHKAKFPGCRYEVGIIELKRLPENHPAKEIYKGSEFVVIYDFIEYKLKEVMGGATANKFVQAYATEKLKLEAKRRGLKTTETKSNDGKIKLVVEGM